MLFNSLSFAIFLPIVFLLYWFITNKNLRLQNGLLLISSYFFYACWDWRFLFLLVFSTFLDYYTGLKIAANRETKIKKIWFWLSISTNLGLLGAFKYYNFFTNSFANAISNLGGHVNIWTLKVILPIGISFYTFHGLSYVIDIYNDRIRAEKSFIDYSVFVCFFPLLIAGPIERATHLLPQIKKKRTFDYTQAVDGLRQILWGLFKKVIIADRCAKTANLIFNNSSDYSGSTLLLGALLFTFQIYGDFSGYSDIALGTARLFGIELLRNFSYPYFSRDIAEFWRRWHISLSSWFKDYLYVPLGGSKAGNWIKVRNTFVIFFVSGFWHGANWTFIIWGILNAVYIMPSIILKTNRNNIEIVAKGKNWPTFKELYSICITFCLTMFAWIFFRSESVGKAIDYIKRIFSKNLFVRPPLQHLGLLLLLFIFMLVEWLGREHQFAISRLKLPKIIRWLFYYALIIAISYSVGSDQLFIYFQF